jgi:hypothetical protein
MRTRRTSLLAVFVGSLFFATSAFPWYISTHRTLTRAAVRNLPPKTVPGFFRDASKSVARCAYDLDIERNAAVPALRDAEGPEHFIDLELLKGAPLPPTRYEYLKLVQTKRQNAKYVGTLPYALLEWTDRLTMAFAEYRKTPADEGSRAKCIVCAGVLAHYAEDACMPLHATIDYDGRATADGSSPKSGFHDAVDGMLEALRVDVDAACAGFRPEPFADVFAAVVAQCKQSNAAVDGLYRLEEPVMKGESTPETAALAKELAARAVLFTQRLFLTAWKNSEKVSLPDFYDPKGK